MGWESCVSKTGAVLVEQEIANGLHAGVDLREEQVGLRTAQEEDAVAAGLDFLQPGSRFKAEQALDPFALLIDDQIRPQARNPVAVSYTHLRAHETVLDLVCRLLLEKKNNKNKKQNNKK